VIKINQLELDQKSGFQALINPQIALSNPSMAKTERKSNFL